MNNNRDNAVARYLHLLDSYIDAFKKVKDDSHSEFATAANLIPQPFYMKHEILTKFRIFKWMYQTDHYEIGQSFQEVVLPPEMVERQQRFVETTHLVSRAVHVWDDKIIARLLDDIRYFYRIQLISREDVEMLKDELLGFIDDLDTTVCTGRFTSEKEVQIYISEVSFETTYSYLQGNDNYYAFLRIFTINSIITRDPEVCKGIREWIMSLKKYSTLITQSGELQRIYFFKTQRELIKEL